MKAEDCTFERTVYCDRYISGHLMKGKILSPVLSATSTEWQFRGNLNPTVVVEWDGDDEGVCKVPVNVLLTEEEGLLEVQRLADAQAQLEREFEACRGPIAYKLAEAAKALDEANKMASATKHNLQDFYDDVRPLMNAIRLAGWRASHFSC